MLLERARSSPLDSDSSGLKTLAAFASILTLLFSGTRSQAEVAVAVTRRIG